MFIYLQYYKKAVFVFSPMYNVTQKRNHAYNSKNYLARVSTIRLQTICYYIYRSLRYMRLCSYQFNNLNHFVCAYMLLFSKQNIHTVDVSTVPDTAPLTLQFRCPIHGPTSEQHFSYNDGGKLLSSI